MKRVLVTLAVCVHLSLVLLVVTHTEDSLTKVRLLRPIRALVDYYSAVTFANRNFGFFAPAVTGDWPVQFITSDAAGQRRAYELNFPNREMQVRMYSMLGHFNENADISDLFARSWALRIFNDNPGVVSVEVEVTQNSVPTMAEFRNGGRIERAFVYRTRFDSK